MSIIIADSSDVMRAGLVSVLKNDAAFSISGEATDSEELEAQIKLNKPSIVIIDYTSKGFSVDVIKKFTSSKYDIKFIAITHAQSSQTLVNAFKSGVTSYVKKDCDLSEILDAVRETVKGNKFYCGQILDVIKRAQLDVDDIEFDTLCDPIILSERENEIIVLISEGYTNNQIADQLFLSNHTITTHRKNIMAKLGVKNTAGIVMYAVKTNLISPNKFLFSPTD
jgi:DNA-binding NarL/FixJ family response regulator